MKEDQENKEQNTSDSSKREEFVLSGSELLEKVKQLIKEGNVRRVIIKSENDDTLMEIPLTWAAVGALVAPVLAAVGALAALLTKCKIIVEKK